MLKPLDSTQTKTVMLEPLLPIGLFDRSGFPVTKVTRYDPRPEL